MPDRTARVGIVIRTKNRPWFFRRALADVVAQDFDDWQVHVVNDGGPRDVVDAAIAALPADQRARVTVSHNDAPHGRSAAANEGVSALETEFVVLHDDDDLWHPSFLTRTTAWLDSHPDDIGVAVRTEIVYEEPDDSGGYAATERVLFWAQLDEISYSDLLVVNRMVPIGYLYRRDVHDEVGLYREDVHAAEDWEFNLRVAARHHIGFIDAEPLAFWMQRVDQMGELGNSMFALADEHIRYDRRIRDEALRAYVHEHGPGLPLFLAGLIRDTVRETVQQELDRRPSDLDRIRRRLRDPFRRRH